MFHTLWYCLASVHRDYVRVDIRICGCLVDVQQMGIKELIKVSLLLFDIMDNR